MTDGIPFPAIEQCPECDHKRLWATELTHEGVTVDLDGSGGIAEIHSDDLIDIEFLTIGCVNCDTTLVEDGEIVHPDIQ